MRRLLLGAAATVLVGCGTTDPNNIEDVLLPGEVSFDYTGAGTSTSTKFEASGIISSTDPTWGTTPVAVAEARSSAPVRTQVLAATPTTADKWNQMLLNVTRISVGTTSIATTCFGVDCPGSWVQVEFQAPHGFSTSVATYVCVIFNGSITISSIEPRRVVGSFSGTGQCREGSNAMTPFAITNGAFDVGILIPGKTLPKG